MNDMLYLRKDDILTLRMEMDRQQEMVILMHHNPDGDALGSALALSIYLEQFGHRCCVIAPNEFPDFLRWMPQADKVHIGSLEPDFCRKKITEAGFIFCLDFNRADRIQDLQQALEQSNAYKALIDHHIDPDTSFFDFIYSVTTETSSTCELVYNFIVYYMADKKRLNKAIAECLYVGMITDTGSLSYSCGNPSTYTAVGNLIQMGISGEDIHRKVYDNYSESRMRLLGFSLSERLHVLREYATSYIYLTREDLERFNYKQGDTEGIVNYGLSMQDVRFTAFFSERDGVIRVSFRSKGDFDVNVFAREYFNGGGHRNAAGGNSHDSMEETIARFRKALDNVKDQLKPQCTGKY